MSARKLLSGLGWTYAEKHQCRSHSSSAISDVRSYVKLVGKIRRASSGHSDSANWPGNEAGERCKKDASTPLIFITISSFVARAERAGMSGESI